MIQKYLKEQLKYNKCGALHTTDNETPYGRFGGS